MTGSNRNILFIFDRLKEVTSLDECAIVTNEISDQIKEIHNTFCNNDEVISAAAGIIIFRINKILETYDETALQPLSQSAADHDDLLQINHKKCHETLVLCGNIALKLIKFVKHIFNNALSVRTKLSSYIAASVHLKLQSKDRQWSCDACAQVCKLVWDGVLSMHGCTSLKDCCDKSNKFFSKTLERLLLHINRQSWKRFPASCNAVINFLSIASCENLTKSINELFPLILWMVDDYSSRNMLLGLDGLDIFFTTLPSAEIRSSGRGDVIFDALSKKVYARDAQILKRVLPCLLGCTKALERDPYKADRPRKLTRYDSVLHTMLAGLNVCSTKELVRTYFINIKSCITAMGIAVARHLKSILPVIEYHLDCGDTQTVIGVCIVVESLVMVCWNRHATYLNIVLKLMVKRLLQLPEALDAEQTSLVEAIQRCLLLLCACDPRTVKEAAAEINKMPQTERYDALRSVVRKLLS